MPYLAHLALIEGWCGLPAPSLTIKNGEWLTLSILTSGINNDIWRLAFSHSFGRLSVYSFVRLLYVYVHKSLITTIYDCVLLFTYQFIFVILVLNRLMIKGGHFYDVTCDIVVTRCFYATLGHLVNNKSLPDVSRYLLWVSEWMSTNGRSRVRTHPGIPGIYLILIRVLE